MTGRQGRGLVAVQLVELVPHGERGPVQANVTPSLMYNVDMFDAAGSPIRPRRWKPLDLGPVRRDGTEVTLDTEGRNALDPNFDPENIAQFGVQASLDNNYSYMPFVYSNKGAYLTEGLDGLGWRSPRRTPRSRRSRI